MKIGVDIRALNTDKLTGVGKYIFNYLDNILQLDKDNQYYFFNSGFKKPAQNFSFTTNNFTIKNLNVSNKILNWRLLTRLGPKLDSVFEDKLDLFWLPNINFCQFGSTPLILTIHDLSFIHDRRFFSPKSRLWHYLTRVGALIQRADKIVAVSEHTKGDVINFFDVDSSKIVVINPGLETVAMDKDKARSLVAKFALPQKYFIYVGTLEPRKNINSIIAAFDIYHKDYSDTALVIVGGQGYKSADLLKIINKRPYIKYLAYLDSPIKEALYYLSQGLIWPSFYEGFGFPPLEALACGVPVIASYRTSLPEVLKNQAIYVDPYNISDIYQALKQLTIDDKLGATLKESLPTYEMPKWPSQAQEIIALFNSFKK